MRTIALYNLKGGVGKTAAAVNLAWISARAGARTLLWDLDAQGAATYYFRVKPKIQSGLKKILRGQRPLDREIRGTDYDGLDLIPADFSYRKFEIALDRVGKARRRMSQLTRSLRRDYDHLYLDCPPNLTIASEGIFHAADVLLVPTIPTTLSLRALDQVCKHLRKSGLAELPVLPFWSMVDRRKSLHRELSGLASREGLDFLQTAIPYSSQVEAMGLHRAPVADFAPNGPAAQAFGELWEEALQRGGSRSGGPDTERS